MRSGIISSETVNLLSWQAEVFYRRLMSVADDFGRFDGRASILRATLFPLKLDHVREADIVTWIGECHEAGLVRLYSCSQSKPHLEITKFDQRQREGAKSRWPDPYDASFSGDPPQVAASRGDCPPIRVRYSGSSANAGSQSDGPTDNQLFADLLPKSFGAETRKLWLTHARMRFDMRKPYTPNTVGTVMKEMEARGETTVREALSYSIQASSPGLSYRSNGTKPTEPLKIKPMAGPAKYEPKS